MKSVKIYLTAFLGLALSLIGADAFAVSPLETLTSTVDLTAISLAMTVVFSGMITVGIFLHGGQIIARKLGWK